MKILSILVAAIAAISQAQGADSLYTLVPVSVITDTGVIGFPVGTEVTHVKDENYQIGKYIYYISKYHVSSDVARVQAAIHADAQGRAQLVEIQKKEQEEREARERVEAEARLKEAQEARERIQSVQPTSIASQALGKTIRK